MRKSMVEALQSVPSAWDMAQGFYGDVHVAPIQEVILPMTTSAEELSLVEAYYRKIIVGQEDRTLLDGQSVKDWVGEFLPKRVRVIPLIEDMEHILHCDRIVEEYVQDRDLPYQRVFLARSDPALNYGIVGAELILKVGLLRLHHLERKLGLPLYPIIGAGSVPFRGHLTPSMSNALSPSTPRPIPSPSSPPSSTTTTRRPSVTASRRFSLTSGASLCPLCRSGP